MHDKVDVFVKYYYNIKYYLKKNVAINEINLYLAHFFGSRDAYRFIQTNKSLKAKTIFLYGIFRLLIIN